MRNGKFALHLFVSLLLAYAAGAVGAYVTTGTVLSTWYLSLDKSSLNPPNAVFGPVWTLLYTLMAFAAWRIYERRATDPRAYRALIAYGIHLLVNAAWAIAFFGLEAPMLALAIIIVLLIFVLILTVIFYRIDRVSGLLFMPYLLWIAFAAYLNLSIVLMN